MRKAILIAFSITVAAASAPTAQAALHVVDQVGLEFQPADLTVDQGDTVRWVWSGGTHTVTNGTGGDDDDAGTLFDASLTSGSTTFDYVFTAAGTYPYFCRPHEALGMKGTITVDETTPVQPATWGRIKRIFEQTGR